MSCGVQAEPRPAPRSRSRSSCRQRRRRARPAAGAGHPRGQRAPHRVVDVVLRLVGDEVVARAHQEGVARPQPVGVAERDALAAVQVAGGLARAPSGSSSRRPARTAWPARWAAPRGGAAAGGSRRRRGRRGCRSTPSPRRPALVRSMSQTSMTAPAPDPPAMEETTTATGVSMTGDGSAPSRRVRSCSSALTSRPLMSRSASSSRRLASLRLARREHPAQGAELPGAPLDGHHHLGRGWAASRRSGR